MGLIINFVLMAISLGGIVFILWRKIPLLVELSDPPVGGGEMITRKVKNIVSSQKIKSIATKNLDKTLSTARTLASKTEHQTGEWLNQLQKKSESRREEFSESYWDQLRKRGKKKNPPA